MSEMGDFYRERKEANQKHRWSQFKANTRHAEKAGAVFTGDDSTWIFALPDGEKVHFYPTKNWWRFAGGHKTPSQSGGFRKFWKWFLYQTEQRKHSSGVA